MKNQKGITLIALVITIIVLIILAGVAINLTLGENGILRRAEQSKESYNLAKEKEALEIEIMEVQLEILDTEGRKATLNDLQNKIDTSKYTIELHYEPVATTENVNTVPTYAIVNRINTMYYFTVDSDLVITDIELAEPATKYINFSEITWENGKASITLSTDQTGTIEYKIGEDGTYQEGTTIENLNHADEIYARINNNGQYTEDERKIIYDIINPEEFTISVSEDTITYEALKITSAGTTDNQTGIRDYSFVVTKDGTVVQEIKNQEVTEYTIQGLSSETEYVVYMLAYDNAGNPRKSNKITVTTLTIPVAKMIGQHVNYPIDIDDNLNDYDWQIFYKNDNGDTFIIADYYVPASKMTTSLSNAGMRLYSGIYQVNWSSVPTSKTITDNLKSIFMYDHTNTSSNHAKTVSRLLDSTAWKNDFVTKDLEDVGGIAIGAPTIKMWLASWNKVYPNNKITITADSNGYGVNGNLASYAGYSTDAPNVYFPIKNKTSDGTHGYWVAGICDNNRNYLMGVCYQGIIGYNYGSGCSTKYDGTCFGIRPLLYLPSSVTLEPSGTANLWNINYGTTNN